MRRAVESRLTALEDRRWARDWRAMARADALTPAETEAFVGDMRREMARLRVGLRPSTLADVMNRHADELGLTGDERAAFIAEMTAKIEARQAGQTIEV